MSRPYRFVIADDEKALGIAGVMGGKDSGSYDDTVNVFLESAYFDPVRIARTGRMHQVRAHLAHVGSPISGDALYGGAALPEHPGFFLHAAKVALPDGPEIEAPLPARFSAALSAVGL